MIRELEQLIRLLAVHETAEEEVVYPAVRAQVPNGEALADVRTEEEDHAKSLLSDLEKVGVESPEFDAQLQAAEQLILHHANAEESQVFPRLREVLANEELRDLASGVQKAEVRTHAPAPPRAGGRRRERLGWALRRDRRPVRDAIRAARK
ncbi:MAG: hemerythrin domain-containing protein [Actinomycetota bacterium]|nr:hemerythrin domain-containing protein [Actinomycetota bacterium]